MDSISHYLFDCPIYKTEKEIKRKLLFETCGISHIDLNLLLNSKQDDEFKDLRNYKKTELEKFVMEWAWFFVCLI